MNYKDLFTASKTALYLLENLLKKEDTNQNLLSIKAQLQFINNHADNNINPISMLEGKSFSFGILSSREFASPEELFVKNYIDRVSHLIGVENLELGGRELAIIEKFVDTISDYKKSLDEKINSCKTIENLLPEIDYILGGTFNSNKVMYNLQKSLKSELYSLIHKMLDINDDYYCLKTIELFCNKLENFNLVTLDFKTILTVHKGYFRYYFIQDLFKVTSKMCSNANLVTNSYMGIYLHYPDFAEIAQLDKEIALETFPVMLDLDWKINYKVYAAKTLFKLGEKSDKVINLKDLLEADFQSDFFQSENCLPLIKEYLEENYSSVPIKGIEREDFEEHLIYLADSYNYPSIIAFLRNKWQGSDWEDLTITLDNEWKFHLYRYSFVERCRIKIQGHERRRDDFYADNPEQLEWFLDVLAEFENTKYFQSWVLDFAIIGEDLLQFLLKEMRQIGIKETKIKVKAEVYQPKAK